MYIICNANKTIYTVLSHLQATPEYARLPHQGPNAHVFNLKLVLKFKTRVLYAPAKLFKNGFCFVFVANHSGSH